MVKNPLAGAFEAEASSKKSRKSWVSLGVLAFAGLASVGTVFAANVSINSGSTIIFSQGSETIAACDPDGISAELSAFYNGTAFALDYITLTGVHSDCDNKTLDLQLFDGATKMLTVTGTLSVESADGNTQTVTINEADNIITAETSVVVGSSTNAWVNIDGNVVVTFDSGTAITMAADADSIVVEIN